MPDKSNHVIPSPTGGWSVKKGGAPRASRRFETKSDAISWGREVSEREKSELVIHKLDGTVERKDSYAGDPMPDRAYR